MFTSHRWTWRSASRMNSRLSSSGTPASAPPGSTAIRAAIAQSRPTASSSISSSSSQNRARFEQRAAVLVAALVVERGQELAEQVGVRAVRVDDVVARVARPLRGLHPVGLDAPDVGLRHRPRDEAVVVAGDLRGADRGQARVGVVPVDAAVEQLDAGQRAVRVRLLRHHADVRHVAVVPHAERGRRAPRRHRGRWRVLGADGGPSALRLHRPVMRLRERLGVAEARAVRHLVEPVPEGLRADLEGLEEDVVPRVTGHARERTGCLTRASNAGGGRSPQAPSPAVGITR